jgi:hypothetical protein
MESANYTLYTADLNKYLLSNSAVKLLGRLVAGFPQRWPRFQPRSGRVGFVMDKAALGKVFSEYFGFPCQSFHRLLHTHHHPTSEVGTQGQTVAAVPSGLSLNAPPPLPQELLSTLHYFYERKEIIHFIVKCQSG